MCHTLVIFTLLSNRHIQHLDLQTWANPESFFRGVQILDIYFLSHFFALVIIFYRGEMGRPSSADQRNAISMATSAFSALTKPVSKAICIIMFCT